jgi:signal transduction histidine kinase/ActR/RegA family two-component response regulator
MAMTIPRANEHEGRVLVLAPSGRDGALTEKALVAAGMSVAVCTTPTALAAAMDAGVGALLLTEEALVPPVLDLLRTRLARQLPWSDLPIVVVATKRPDDRQSRSFHERVTALGNVTILERPLNPRSLVSALASGLRARHRQYEARDLLARIELEVARRDQFLAMLGHELRNPLGAIRNVAEILQRSAPAGPDGPRTDRQLAILARQTRHLTRIVDDLLEVSRVSAGKVTLNRARLELEPLVEAVVEQLAPAAKQQRLELSFRAAAGRTAVYGDPVRLEQIFGNLVTNAIKYTPPGGRVEVIAEAAGQAAKVRVRDTGVGIAAEMLPTVFELFSQIENTLERSQGGMGIGLTLARSLVKLHGGEIEATSRGLGLGAEFVVTLPLAEPRAAPPSSLEVGVPPAQRGRRIVIVDDSPDNLVSLQDLLECLGHRVDAAADGLQAVDRIVALEPEIAIVDIGLPGIDGHEVARRVRKAIGGSVYLIALTGYGQAEDVERATSAGFDAHVAKPADIDALQRLIEARPGAPAAR